MTATVIAALRSPAALPDWPLERWEELVRQARSANLLSRVAADLDALGVLHLVPAAPGAHLVAARIVARAQDEAVRREVRWVLKALAPIGADIVLLKGAAYLLAGLRAARGRVFADIDILVASAALPEVEASLMLHGWATTHHNAYDQRYYRRWMHELPPLRHMTRGTVLDVHHAILPRTARLKPDTARLLAAAAPLPGAPGMRILAPTDIVLHSAAHLFMNEELSSALRDLTDLDALLREFGRRAGFWEELVHRSRELDLQRPLYYGLRYARRLLETPVPEEVMAASAAGAPPALLRALMDALFMRILSHRDLATPLARKSLYLRGHWLRMPLPLLAYHLTVKALRAPEENAG